MDADFCLFSTSRVTDRRRLKRGHHVEAHHVCNKEDTAVRLLFTHADIKFYLALDNGHISLVRCASAACLTTRLFNRSIRRFCLHAYPSQL